MAVMHERAEEVGQRRRSHVDAPVLCHELTSQLPQTQVAQNNPPTPPCHDEPMRPPVPPHSPPPVPPLPPPQLTADSPPSPVKTGNHSRTCSSLSVNTTIFPTVPGKGGRVRSAPKRESHTLVRSAPKRESKTLVRSAPPSSQRCLGRRKGGKIVFCYHQILGDNKNASTLNIEITIATTTTATTTTTTTPTATPITQLLTCTSDRRPPWRCSSIRRGKLRHAMRAGISKILFCYHQILCCYHQILCCYHQILCCYHQILFFVSGTDTSLCDARRHPQFVGEGTDNLSMSL